jgi:hypothetical protein
MSERNRSLTVTIRANICYFSDYDGTLSPTTFFNSNEKTVRIPNYNIKTGLDPIL